MSSLASSEYIYHKKGNCNKGQVCAFVHSETEIQGNDKKKRMSESISIATTPHYAGGDPVLQGWTDKNKVNKFQMSKNDEAKAHVRDTTPTRESNPSDLLFSDCDDCEDWAEYLAEDAQVKAWKVYIFGKEKRDVSGHSMEVLSSSTTWERRKGQSIATFHMW